MPFQYALQQDGSETHAVECMYTYGASAYTYGAPERGPGGSSVQSVTRTPTYPPAYRGPSPLHPTSIPQYTHPFEQRPATFGSLTRGGGGVAKAMDDCITENSSSCVWRNRAIKYPAYIAGGSIHVPKFSSCEPHISANRCHPSILHQIPLVRFRHRPMPHDPECPRQVAVVRRIGNSKQDPNE